MVVVNTGWRQTLKEDRGWTWNLEMVCLEEPTLEQRLTECPEDDNGPRLQLGHLGDDLHLLECLDGSKRCGTGWHLYSASPPSS